MTLMDYLPQHYQGSEQVRRLQDALDAQTTALRAAWDDCMIQLDVATATWGLDYWESALGITKKAADSFAFRRSRVISKLRGSGVTTAELIRTVAASFANGDVEVVETPESYTFTVKFTGTLGIPPNMADLTAAIEEIKPAHLAYSYEYTLRTHAMLAAYTHAQLAAYTHEEMRSGEMT